MTSSDHGQLSSSPGAPGAGSMYFSGTGGLGLEGMTYLTYLEKVLMGILQLET